MRLQRVIAVCVRSWGTWLCNVCETSVVFERGRLGGVGKGEVMKWMVELVV